MIRTEKAHLPVIALTHEGMRGKNNEDRFAVSSFQLNAAQGNLPVLLAVVSDGVGGHRAGEVASEMTANMVSNVVGQSDGSNPVNILQQAIRSASNQIFALGQTSPDFEGMGATVVCAMIIGHRLYTATVGDSRVYLLRDGQAHQISIDHTWINEALEAGLISPNEVAGHPNLHVIRRYLGSPKPPEVDFRLRLKANESNEKAIGNQGLQLKAGDHLLLCTDGLSDLVNANEIYATLTSQPLDKAVKALIDLANSRGGHDNITIAAIDIPNSASKFESLLTPRNISLVTIGLVSVCMLVSLTIIVWLTSNWITSRLPTNQPVQISLQPVIINRLPSLQTTIAPLPTFTLIPDSLIDKASSLTQTATSPYRLWSGDQATLTPWPTNTLTPNPTSSPTPQTTLTIAPGGH